MRKDAKAPKTTTLNRVQGYHEGGFTSQTNYAFLGFTSNKYFTSDRFIKLDQHFNRPDGKPLKGFGLEIETECRGLNNATVYAEVLANIIFKHFPDDLFKLQHDGSLGGDTSAECITQVMTREFIRNHYQSFRLMYDTYFPAFGISCSRSGNCGMHVNISNGCFGRSQSAQETAIRKLLYIANKHYSLCCSLTYRGFNRHYCARMLQFTTQEACKNADLNNMPSSHGNCCNFSHFPEGRIELRFVGGQRNFGGFRNTMECIFHLVEAVKTLTWAECDSIEAIFAGCNQYVYDRLRSRCKDAGDITDSQLAAIRETVKREELV